METICDCGCVFDDGGDEYPHRPAFRTCPVCKLRNDIPAMLDVLYERTKERGTWDKYY